MTSINPVVIQPSNVGAQINHQFSNGNIAAQGTVPIAHGGHGTLDVSGSYKHNSGVGISGSHGTSGTYGGATYNHGNHQIGVHGGTHKGNHQIGIGYNVGF